MIDFLRGIPESVGSDWVVLDVNGVGYRVFCTNPYEITKGNLNQETKIFIHHHVREDAEFLYGFSSRLEQSLFRRLIEVSGIGPKVALGMLSGARAEDIIRFVQFEDITALTRLPGVGKKTAQRLLLDLKDKLDDLGLTAIEGTETNADAGRINNEESNPIQTSDAWNEIREGLKSLGYTEGEVEKALRQIQQKAEPNDSPDQLLKMALQALYSG